MGSKFPCGEATPMEETVEALLDTLVAPLLPKSYSNRSSLAESLEQSIGKQMHAVVLLYNYIHRKQFPEVKFLDYQPFLKTAVIAKKMLLSFVNYGQGGRQTITEKIMIEAFDIFGSVIHGVWSMIENDITIPATHASGHNNLEKQTTLAKNFFHGTQQTKQVSSPITLDEEALLQVAYSAVHEKTGLDSSSLMVLQGDYVGSFSKGRSTTRFYLMQCLKEAGEKLEKVPIEDALNSLRRPIVSKISDGYETTKAVTYFQLFPYENIISIWISNSSKNLQPVVGLGNITTTDNSSYSLKENKASDVSSQLSYEGFENLSDTKNHATDENGLEKENESDSREDKRRDENLDGLSGSGTENHATDEKSSRKKKRRHGEGKKCGSETKKNQILVHGNDYQKGVKPDGSDAYKGYNLSTSLSFREVPFIVADDQVVRPCCKQLEPFHNIGGASNTSENVTRNQELDEVCSQNSWALPIYTVSPSKGGFVASVTVHCLDISCSADGNERSKPQVARESAATCMLKKLRDMVDHV